MAVTAPTTSVSDNYERYAQYFDKEAANKDDLSMDTFYKLLTAEMSNQDPMEPMSNTEFISQMASMTSLQTQQDALYYNNANYAASLVGKTVTAAAMAGTEMKSDTGIVTSMNLSGGTFRIKVNGADYLLSNVMEVLPTVNPYNASSQDVSAATALIGKQVTVTSKNSAGDSIIEVGIAQRVEIKDGEVTIVVNDLAFPLSGVTKVENPVTANGDSSTDDDDETYTSTADSETALESGAAESTEENPETKPLVPEETEETEQENTDASESDALRQMFE
jgi:flagellar basal-body rod modification protein FlgD